MMMKEWFQNTQMHICYHSYDSNMTPRCTKSDNCERIKS